MGLSAGQQKGQLAVLQLAGSMRDLQRTVPVVQQGMAALLMLVRRAVTYSKSR
jgi:hypothetical protein